MKRFIILTLICLLLGALTTLGVAAAARTLAPLAADFAGAASWRHLEAPEWDLSASSGPGAVFVNAWHRDGASDAITIEHPAMPRWCSFRHLPAKTDDDPHVMMVAFGYGWPYLCLTDSGAVEFDPDSTAVLSRSWSGFRFIWGGLGTNIAAYASLWMLLIRLPGALRYWRRKRRGLCLNCRYDLRGATSEVCSECGENQPDLAVAARSMRRFVAACLVITACAGITYAMVLSVRQHRVQRAFEARSTWFDEWLDPWMSHQIQDDPSEFLARVQRDPKHEGVFAARLPELTDDTQLWGISGLIRALAARDPRPGYLDLADQIAMLAGEHRWDMAADIYGSFPFSHVADRLLAKLGEPDQFGVAFRGTCEAWEVEPAPDRADELTEILRANLDSAVGTPSFRAYVLYWLLEQQLIDPEECQERMNDLLIEDPDLENSEIAEWIRGLLKQREGGQKTPD